MIKICENCGNEWNARRTSQKFCCVECRHESRSKSGRTERVCANAECSKEFTRVKSDPAKYCSRSCSATVNNSKHPKRMLEGECRVCESPTPSYRSYCDVHTRAGRPLGSIDGYDCIKCLLRKDFAEFPTVPSGKVSAICLECTKDRIVNDRVRIRNRSDIEVEKFREAFRPGGEKRCRECRLHKQFDHFYRDRTARDGLSHRCKVCTDNKGASERRYIVNRLVELYGDKCMHPDCEESAGLHIDHVVPLALGGCDEFDNYQLLCQHHNCSKGATYIDYRPK